MLKRIAFQGEHGSFGEEAAHEFFAGESEIVACPSLADLHRVVETNAVDYAVLPVENSLIGKVLITSDFLAAHDWREVGNLYLPIQLHLIGTKEAQLKDLVTVTSHPAALAQCRAFFYQHPHLTQVENDNTAASVKRVISEDDKTRAAIGSRQAAQLFGGKIVQADIQDKQENFTKFLLLKK